MLDGVWARRSREIKDQSSSEWKRTGAAPAAVHRPSVPCSASCPFACRQARDLHFLSSALLSSPLLSSITIIK